MPLKSKCAHDFRITVWANSIGTDRILCNACDMSPPLHTRNETAIEVVGGSRWFCAKESEVDRICQREHEQRILGCEMDYINGLPWKRKKNYRRILLQSS
ncbi:hypothetical protein TNCV_3529731 [Trichonephila clavipes]|uniref:Uncharacterized protein n=1 Tax=Trichonephila clavipes TaxID=2585209 RepID=A0A8X6RFV2_TRICX|nr:hypothetical protein TNCV_3529731 [Trichonephila clavipes]